MYGTLGGALAGRKIAFDRDAFTATVDGRIKGVGKTIRIRNIQEALAMMNWNAPVLATRNILTMVSQCKTRCLRAMRMMLVPRSSR